MGALVDCAATVHFHAIPPVARRTANAKTTGERNDFPSREAIYMAIIAVREAVAARNRSVLITIRNGVAEPLSCRSLVKHIHRFARPCCHKFRVNTKDVVDGFRTKHCVSRSLSDYAPRVKKR